MLLQNIESGNIVTQWFTAIAGYTEEGPVTHKPECVLLNHRFAVNVKIQALPFGDRS